MVKYNVSEIFSTIQGEGCNAGRPCVFLRFSFCNLWKNKDVPSKTCPWCDTPQLFDSDALGPADLCAELQRAREKKTFGLVITGGEPLLQLDETLLHWCLTEFPWIDIETNGTQSLDKYADIRKWAQEGNCLCTSLTFSCSPKTSKFTEDADQYKLLIPDNKKYVEDCINLVGAERTYLQPIEPKAGIQSDEYKENLKETLNISYRTGGRVCLQQHKYLHVR